MNSTDEFKIVFTGPMGAGKTTAIATISDEAPVSTDVDNTDRSNVDKDSTTAGLDYGTIRIEGGQCVRLYGTPGQLRYRFMWDILGANAANPAAVRGEIQPAPHAPGNGAEHGGRQYTGSFVHVVLLDLSAVPTHTRAQPGGVTRAMPATDRCSGAGRAAGA